MHPWTFALLVAVAQSCCCSNTCNPNFLAICCSTTNHTCSGCSPGGVRLLRYGSLHASVLGLEVVLSSGKVLNLLAPLRKNNTGIHLHHAFIGSEGALGKVGVFCLFCFPVVLLSNCLFMLLCTCIGVSNLACVMR